MVFLINYNFIHSKSQRITLTENIGIIILHSILSVEQPRGILPLSSHRNVCESFNSYDSYHSLMASIREPKCSNVLGSLFAVLSNRSGPPSRKLSNKVLTIQLPCSSSYLIMMDLKRREGVSDIVESYTKTQKCPTENHKISNGHRYIYFVFRCRQVIGVVSIF